MDVAVLLILPLVGGYIFARTWNYSRYAAAREEGHRLYFRAAFYAVFLFSVSIELRFLLIATSDWYRAYETVLREAVETLLQDPDKPYQVPLAIISVHAMLLAAPAGELLNIVFPASSSLRRAVARDDFERLLHDAVQRRVPVAVTMENRKVYIGFVLRTFDPSQPRKTLALLPLVSGYRAESDGRLHLTTKYSDIYGTLQPDRGHKLPPPLDHLSAQDFEIVLPVDKVHSLGFFDLVAYAEFGQEAGGPSSATSTVDLAFDPPPHWRP